MPYKRTSPWQRGILHQAPVIWSRDSDSAGIDGTAVPRIQDRIAQPVSCGLLR